MNSRKGHAQLCFDDGGGFGDADGLAGFAFEAGHADPVEPAGRDGQKRWKALTCDIDGKAVHADPFAHANPDRGELAVFHPDAREAVASTGVDAKGSAALDQGIFDQA